MRIDVRVLLLFSQDHEWITMTGDVGTIGITDHAQEQLGDVVFVELPEVGSKVEKDETMGAVESVKAASDIYSPVSGTVEAVNEALNDEPALVNTSAEVRPRTLELPCCCCCRSPQLPFFATQADGWMAKVKLSDASELDGLMDADAYADFCKE